MGVGGDSEGTNLRNVVYCRVEGGPAFVLGSLRSGVCEDLSLDLVFEAGKRVIFFASGPGDVHLTGYYVSHFVEPDEYDDDEEEEDDDDDDDDDGDITGYIRPRRGPAKKKAKRDPLGFEEFINSDDEKKSGNKEEEDEDEDDEEEEEMKSRNLLASLVGDDTLDDDEDDGDFELGDTAEEEAADAEAQLEMEKELKIKHRDYSKPPAPKTPKRPEKKDEDKDTEGDSASAKKVRFSPVAGGDEEDEDSEEHKRKAALLDARQATPYVLKESLLHRNRQAATIPDSQKEQEAKKGKAKNAAPAGRDTKEGIHIEDLVVGTGSVPKPGRPVVVRYRGLLDSGKVFDRSGKKPFKFVFGAGQVIRGWDLGIADMRVGGKRKLRIPPNLAYGKEGTGPIPPNAFLTFEIELVKAM